MIKTLGSFFDYPNITREEAEYRTTPYSTEPPSGGIELPNLFTGVECELESCNIYMTPDMQAWSKIHEPSLRGEAGYEYLLAGPLRGGMLSDALEALSSTILKQGIVPDMNVRVSTHVHLNVRNFTLEQLTNVLCTSMAVECLLLNYVGIERENSSYAIPYSRRSQEIRAISDLQACRHMPHDTLTKKSRVKSRLLNVTSTMCKYSSVNLINLFGYGTIEFRHLGGCWEAAKIREWVNILQKIYRYSVEQEELPEMLPAVMSSNGAWQFVHSIFGGYTEKLLYEGYENDVLRGVREAQFVLNVSDIDPDTLKDSFYAIIGRKTLPAAMTNRVINGDTLPRFFNNMHDGLGGSSGCAFEYRGNV